MRKIIHIDMDCFYAAVEIRDNPELQGKPVAVGGISERSVLCTCNYEARKYGIRSAMASKTAKVKCKDLIILPVNMHKYRAVAKNIHTIFKQYTDLVEPLALDEAYLDVSDNHDFKNSATLIAEDIRQKIFHHEHLTASAGVAPNKFLAKIASGWNKPNGICVIPPQSIEHFVATLDVTKIFGVGKVTLNKLHNLGIKTCSDLQQHSLQELYRHFGKFGGALYNQARGIDERPVIANRERKSLSRETTFLQDISDSKIIEDNIRMLFDKIAAQLAENNLTDEIRTLFIKIKFHDFTRKTVEVSQHTFSYPEYINLIRGIQLVKPIRLIGIGVRFYSHNEQCAHSQPDLFML